MAYHNPKNIAQCSALLLSVLLGGWFLWSGAGKIFLTGLDIFSKDIENYRMLRPSYGVVAAYIIPWVEVSAGICLLLGILRRGAILAATCLVLCFSIAIGWAWKHNLNIACGCHGSFEQIRYWNKAGEFFLYFIILSWLWFIEGKIRNQSIKKLIVTDDLTS